MSESAESVQQSERPPDWVGGILATWIVLSVVAMGLLGDEFTAGFVAVTGIPESMSFLAYVSLTMFPLLSSAFIVRYWGEFTDA